MWLVGFGVSAAFWPGLLSAAVAPRWALLAALTPLVSRLDPRRLDPLVGGLFLTYLGWAALSLLWAPDRLTGAHELFQLIILGVVVLAVANTDRLAPVLLAATLGLAVSSALAIGQFFFGWSFVAQATAPPAGLFYNRDMLAEFAAPLLVWAIASKRLWLAVIPLIPLVLCQSRVALVAAAVGLLAAGSRWGFLILAGIACAAMAALGTLPFNPAKIVSASERWDVWSAALSDPSIFGHGLGSFTAAFPKMETAHSDVLQAFYELGAGAGIMAALGLVVLWRIEDAAERAILFALAVEVLVAHPFHLPATGFLAAALVGVAGRARTRVRDFAHVGGGLVGGRV